jgi:hypothetical protein
LLDPREKDVDADKRGHPLAKKRIDLTAMRSGDHSQEFFPEFVRHGGDHPLKSERESPGR